ncbi:hypothetical protein AB7W15_10565 [Morganella morganii]
MLLLQPEILVFAAQRNKIILNDRFSLSEAGYTQLSSFIVWIQVAGNNPSFFNDTYRHKNKTGAKAPVFRPLTNPQGLATTGRGCKNKPGKSIY